MRKTFCRINTKEELHSVCNITEHILLDKEWEDGMKKSFPYIDFEHYIYKDSFLIRVVRIGKRITTTPFFDLGDIHSLSGKSVSLVELREDTQSFFGSDSSIRVHTGVCPVDSTKTFTTEINDSLLILDDKEVMLSSFRKTTRHLLSGAEEDEMYISQIQNEKELKKAYLLYLKNIRRVANLSVPYSFFKYAYNNKNYNFWVWNEKGDIHAFVLFLKRGKSCHYSLSAFGKAGRGKHASHKLLWHAMCFYHTQGVKNMFLGPTRDDTPLSVFKRGWRGKEYPIFTLEKKQGSGRVSKLLRPLWKITPLFLLTKATKVAGEYLF